MNMHKRLEYSPVDITIALIGLVLITLGSYLFIGDSSKSNNFRLNEEFGVISKGKGSRKFGNSLQFFNVSEKEKLYYGDVVFANEENPIEIKIASDLSSKLIIPKDSMVKIQKEGDEFNLDVSKGSIFFNSNRNRNIQVKYKRGRVQRLKVAKNSQVKISTKKSNLMVEAIKGQVSLQKPKAPPVEVKKGKVLMVGPKESKVVSKLEILLVDEIDPVFLNQVKVNPKLTGIKSFEISTSEDFKNSVKLKSVGGMLNIGALSLGHFYIRFDQKSGYDEFDLKATKPLSLKVKGRDKYYQGDDLIIQWNGRPELMYRLNVTIAGKENYSKLVQGNKSLFSIQDKGKFVFSIEEQRFGRQSNTVSLDIDLNKDLDILAFSGKDDPFSTQRSISLKNPRNKKFGFILKDENERKVLKKTYSRELINLPKSLKPGKYELFIVNLANGKPYYRENFEVGDKVILNKTRKVISSERKNFSLKLSWKRGGDYPKGLDYTLSVFKDDNPTPIVTKKLEGNSYLFKTSSVGSYTWQVQSGNERLVKSSQIESFKFVRPSVGKLQAPKIILKFLDSKDCHEYELQKNKFARKYEVFIYSSRQIVKGKNKLMYKKTLSINKDCIPSTGEGKYLYKYRIIDKWGRVSDFSPRGEIFFPISPLDDF